MVFASVCRGVGHCGRRLFIACGPVKECVSSLLLLLLLLLPGEVRSVVAVPDVT